jgi:hypothetical protein
MTIVRRPNKKGIGREELRTLYPELYRDLVEEGHLESILPIKPDKPNKTAATLPKDKEAVCLLLKSLNQVRENRHNGPRTR